MMDELNIRFKLWVANIVGLLQSAFYFLLAHPLIFVIGVAVIIMIIFIRSCGGGGGGLNLDKIEKQNRENENRKKIELDNTFRNIDNRIQKAEQNVNAAKNQNLSNSNAQQLANMIEQRAKDW
jgi:hypothetical protein